MFANPSMLVGLAVAVLPVVVHLLSRARYRSVDWGAMMFLQGADNAHARSRRPSQWVLLAVRASLVAALAVALARPEIRGPFVAASPAGAGAAPGRRGVAVILLDCSGSMAFDENGRPRMELAREAAKQLLSLHRGDRVSLVLMGQAQPPAERAPTADLWDVGRRIESAEAGRGRADVARGLEDALEAVEPRDPGVGGLGGRGLGGATGPAPGGGTAGSGNPSNAGDPSAAPAAGLLPITFYVVTDRQASNWREVLDGGDEWGQGWRQRVARAGAAARVVVIPVGSLEGENVVVKGVELAGESAVAGQPAELAVTVQNVGPVQWAGLPLTVTVDRRTLPEVKLNLAPDSTTTVRVPVPNGFADPGTHVVAAEVGRLVGASGSGPGSLGPVSPPLPPGGSGSSSAAAGATVVARTGGLAADDRLEAVVEVLEPTRVLIVAGDDGSAPGAPASGGPAGAASGLPAAVAADYLAAALAPFRMTKKRQADPCAVDLAVADRWFGPTAKVGAPRSLAGRKDDAKKEEPRKDDPAADREVMLTSYQVVVLAGVEQLTEGQLAALEQFVADGGGLLVAPGNLTRPDAYDAALYKDGAGLLPVALGDPTSADWADQTSILGFDPSHPALRFLGGRSDVSFGAVVGRYFPVNRITADARVVMRYATGEPFLVEGPPTAVRRGRVLLLTTSPEPAWTTLPSTNSFLPLVQSAVRYLSQAQARRLNLMPGEPIELPFDDSAEGRTVRVRPPDGTDDRQATVAWVGGQRVARYADTEAPGVYQVRIGDPARPRPQLVHVAVIPSREESNLTALTAAEWAKLERVADAQKLDPSVRPISAATALPAPLELWPVALAVVFLLGLLEMRLSKSWGPPEAGDGVG